MTPARSPGRSLVHIPAGPPAPGRPREAAVPMDAVALLYEPAQRTLQRRLRRRHAQSAQAVVPCEASARRGVAKRPCLPTKARNLSAHAAPRSPAAPCSTSGTRLSSLAASTLHGRLVSPSSSCTCVARAGTVHVVGVGRGGGLARANPPVPELPPVSLAHRHVGRDGDHPVFPIEALPNFSQQRQQRQDPRHGHLPVCGRAVAGQQIPDQGDPVVWQLLGDVHAQDTNQLLQARKRGSGESSFAEAAVWDRRPPLSEACSTSRRYQPRPIKPPSAHLNLKPAEVALGEILQQDAAGFCDPRRHRRLLGPAKALEVGRHAPAQAERCQARVLLVLW